MLPTIRHTGFIQSENATSGVILSHSEVLRPLHERVAVASRALVVVQYQRDAQSTLILSNQSRSPSLSNAWER